MVALDAVDEIDASELVVAVTAGAAWLDLGAIIMTFSILRSGSPSVDAFD
jgi:hypothetical protein